MAATTSSASKYIALAQTLPANLLRFLARYPPPQLFTSPQEAQQTGYQLATKNPFKPQKHPATGKWHDPVYSNRRQADLVKLARQHGVEELLPHSAKKTEVKLAKKVALGWRGKGTGVGQNVKGHKHERMLGAKYVAVLSGQVGLDCDGRLSQADTVMQDGQAERGHAQDAGAYQGMEGGKYQEMLLMAECPTDKFRRLVARTGPNGPNKGLHDHDGLLSIVQIFTQYEQKFKTVLPSFRYRLIACHNLFECLP